MSSKVNCKLYAWNRDGLESSIKQFGVIYKGLRKYHIKQRVCLNANLCIHMVDGRDCSKQVIKGGCMAIPPSGKICECSLRLVGGRRYICYITIGHLELSLFQHIILAEREFIYEGGDLFVHTEGLGINIRSDSLLQTDIGIFRDLDGIRFNTPIRSAMEEQLQPEDTMYGVCMFFYSF